MRWTRKNKKRLYDLLYERRMILWNKAYCGDYEGWLSLLESLSIVDIRRDWRTKTWFKEDSTTTITNKNYVIIEHPWWSPHSGQFQQEPGLAVPKDTAKKLLVLGVP